MFYPKKTLKLLLFIGKSINFFIKFFYKLIVVLTRCGAAETCVYLIYFTIPVYENSCRERKKSIQRRQSFSNMLFVGEAGK